METAIYVGIFVGATVLFAAEPGPGFVKLSAETAGKGVRFARIAALGMALGALPHIAVVALGLHALITALPGALQVLKIVGFCYLAWQAWSLLRGRAAGEDGRQQVAEAAREEGTGRRMWRSLRGGFLLVLLNPSRPTVYAAYLALFLRPEAAMPMSGQLFVIGISVVAICLVVDLIFIALARRATGRLAANALIRRIAKYLGASLLGLFGLRLLLSRE